MVDIAIWQSKPYNARGRWCVRLSRRAAKQVKQLNTRVLSVLYLLVQDLQTQGPAQGNGWPNYGKLKTGKRDLRHCHLIKRRPVMVCCWEVVDKKDRILEIYYVGTHEKAPY